MTHQREPREWWIDPNENEESEDCDVRQYDAFNKHPGQGDLLWQSQLVRVIEYSALERARAEIARLNKECISTFLHEQRIAAKDAEIETLMLQYNGANKECQELSAEVERLEKTLSHLPKVPTEPYEKEMAKEILRLRSALERIAGHKMTSIDKIYLLQQCEGFQECARQALGGGGE